LFNSNLQTAAAEQAMIDAAEEVIAGIDSTKFGHQALAHVCPLNRITRLVADDELDAVWRERLTAAGVALSLAPRLAEAASA
jgi:DeoR/GlpR family transcriptional regulator of sugar metabolism